MAASIAMFVFIPHSLINERLQVSYLLGYWQITKNNILVNCTATVERNNNGDESLYQLLNIKSQGDGKQNIRLLGLLYSSSEEKYLNTQILRTYLHDVQLILRVNELSGSFHIESAIVNNFTHELDIRVIIYDGCSIAKSQLLPLTKKLSDPNHFQESFISFLIETNQNFVNNSCNYLNHEVSLNSANISDFTQYDEDGTVSVLVSRFIFVTVWVISYFYRLVFTLFEWWPSYLVNMMLLTALGQQFHQRYLHCASLFEDFTANIPLSVKCKNLICAILIDLFCGCLVTYAFLNTNISDVMLNSAILQTNDIVSGLQNLINWLMGVPAGLKLNIPLNNALGKFFLYHIYLWESYMMVVQPLFAFIFKMSTIIGIFGLTFILSLLSDLISLATIHIYCFYGYATRLYGYQVMSLSALWRLFRGKKWNPLRQRIDSYTYNVHQLYLGTLIFTVLLFLLPTVMVYYFVFTCLRILVLIIQGLMSRIINIVTICPMYSAISRLMNSSETTGDVYFTVFNAEGVLTLSMQASQIPLKDVIQLTLPDLKKYQEVLTWKEFISCIIWGKIVYPL